jgi:hypothetical protein
MAWVSGPDDVKERCQALGLNCDGLVKVRSTPRPRPQVREVPDDVVTKAVEQDVGFGEIPAAEMGRRKMEMRERLSVETAET